MKMDRYSGLAAAPSTPDSLTTDYGARRWYLLGLLAMINLMGAIDRVVVSVISEPLKAEFSLSDKQLGLMSGLAYTASFALAVLPMGWLVDRINRRLLLTVTVTIWSGLTACCATASNFATLFVLRMGIGAGEAPIIPSSMSLIADTFPAKRRNTAISLFLTSAGLGMLIQFMVGGWLLHNFGWRAVFLVAGGPGLIIAALLLFTIREPARGTYDPKQSDGRPLSHSAPGVFDAVRRIAGDGVLLLCLPAIAVTTGVVSSMILWGTSFLVRVHGLSVGQASVWMGMGFGICMTIGSLIAGPIADRFSQGDVRRLTLIPAVTTFIAAIGGATLALADPLPVAVAGLGILGFMAGVYLGPVYAIVLGLLAPNERGIIFATIKVFTTFVGGSAITFMTGAISDAIGGADSIRPAIFSNAALLLVATFCFLMIYRILGKRNEASQSLPAA